MIDHSVADERVLATITVQQRDALARLCCPYCRVQLPESFVSGAFGGYWEHSIPTTSFNAICAASTLRTTIVVAMLKYETK